MSSAVLQLPTAAAALFRAIEAVPDADAVVQPAPPGTPYTHFVSAGTDAQAVAIAASLLTREQVPLLHLAGRDILVQLGDVR